MVKTISFLFLFVSPSFLFASTDVEKTVGVEECAECHEDEVFIWKNTRHYKTFNETARRAKGREIAKKMKIRNPTKSELCSQCHFTKTLHNGKPKAVSGVSCESCHGSAKEWFKIHSNYGDKDTKKSQETVEHKHKRIQQSLQAGMIKPQNIYALVNNCMQCHLVPHEDLVNNSKHEAGSKFELVSWSQGRNRHNFMRSAGGSTNIESDQNRKRLLYVVGQLVEMEHTLRALSKATTSDKYSDALLQRAHDVEERVKTISVKINVDEIQQILTQFQHAPKQIKQSGGLLDSAENIQKLAQMVSMKYDATSWGNIDSLIPSEYKGFPAK
jgi:hypothetical protein